jgi:hypothetical protein
VHAHDGDRLVVEGTRVGSPRREGEVLETHGPDGGPPFLVRWSDGAQCLVYPGTDAHIEPGAPTTPAAPAGG